MVRILYTKYQLHISNGSKDIMSARKISCQQGFTIAIMAQSKKGHNFAILGPTEKNTCSLIFCTDATYKHSRFYTFWFHRLVSKIH